MRRRIRLTGRKQLARSSVAVKIAELPGKRLLTLSLAEPQAYRHFPPDARIAVRLHENKLVEIVDFGTIGSPKAVTEIQNQAFAAPSCQLRIAAAGKENQGLLLASTDTWTLRADNNQQDTATKGILLFQPAAIQPRAWKLDIRENEYPIVYIDERIPDPRTWARTDPVFLNSALPAILFQVFDDILDQTAPNDIDWMSDWIRWADVLMPGKEASDRRKIAGEKGLDRGRHRLLL